LPPVERLGVVAYTLTGGFLILNYFREVRAFSEHSTWEEIAHLLRSGSFGTTSSNNSSTIEYTDIATEIKKK